MSTHEDYSRAVHGGQSSDRSFGLVMAVALAVIGLWPLRHGMPPRLWPLLLGGLFLLIGLARPSLLRPLNRLWTRFGLLLSKITNPLILGAMFYLVFTPVGLVLRLFGKDLLRLKSRGQPTFWLPRQPPGPPPESMANQF